MADKIESKQRELIKLLIERNEISSRFPQVRTYDPENIDDLKMGDIDEWDSMGNFNLILAIEQKYGIRFNIEDLDKLRSVKEIKKLLDNDFSK